MTAARAHQAADGPILADGVRVCTHECATCIFRPGNLMGLRPGRVREMVDGSEQENSAIVCHKTLEGPRAICRGWFDRHAGATIMGRLARQRPIDLDPDTAE